MPHCAPSPEQVRELVEAVVAEVIPEPAVGNGALAADDRGIVVPPHTGSEVLADVALGADHGGFHLKQAIGAELREHGFTVHDCGTGDTGSVDYPDFAHAVARLVGRGECSWGIVVDGAGIGSAIAANKVPGVRAATCWDISSAKNSREHNHANVLALGAGLLGEVLALQIVRAWLSTAWGGGRHARRVEKIAEIERRYVGAR